MIKHTTWKGLPAVSFGAGGYEALIIPSYGGQLIELRYVTGGLDILHTPHNVPLQAYLDRPQIFGVPVLFPPNRIEDGTFTRGGKTYQFTVNETAKHNHIHGFLRTRPWRVFSERDDSGEAAVGVRFECTRETDFFPEYQHEFTIDIVYTLSSGGLSQSISITNKSGTPMPVGLGFHTAFNVPFRDGGNADDYSLLVSVGERWKLSDRTLPVGKPQPLSSYDEQLRTGGVKPQGQQVNGHYTAKPLTRDGKPFNGAVLRDAAAGVSVVYEVSKEFGHWMVWNNSGDMGYICPEPQTWAVNAPNIDLPDEVTGFRFVEPGVTWEAATGIYVEKDMN